MWKPSRDVMGRRHLGMGRRFGRVYIPLLGRCILTGINGDMAVSKGEEKHKVRMKRRFVQYGRPGVRGTSQTARSWSPPVPANRVRMWSPKVATGTTNRRRRGHKAFIRLHHGMTQHNHCGLLRPASLLKGSFGTLRILDLINRR